MITLTRINGEHFTLNADLIETVETTPDTVIKLFNGHRYVVRENMEEIVELVVQYRNRIWRSSCQSESAIITQQQNDK
ncbi:MAG: flagellar FlbD family protein [Aminobacterium sp.]|jgi:flagellar protein FlbD|uniref:flagellar FlbD family protein n=1 Tax=unclassified Aminobacterium TaxID=2685012 RepID=UPI001BD00AC8|nr:MULTISPECIES: flagellar FlbD family protein [unclassified Aminobacterium]MDD2207072.1 flagellar FlbD family protein [Aminobacterium sp.]MDD3425600.1 flagellar FlbD family protein [Aminobacterium sp.]MDD3707433.1 flagellar FlbD family protein [Aminobacterium sp.]MDD4228775.1 flagellar FlbD family protein [Aminobacterium sp.]MDD4550606.1 flagellar FlbD family protein [Aminobacterium sp.]